MNIEEQAKELLKILLPVFSQYSNEYKLAEIYNFNINRKIYGINNLFTYDEQIILNKSNNQFEENVLLKEIISKKLVTEKDPMKYYKWIVKNWGGITIFNKNIETIDNFFDQLNGRRIISKYYYTISSLSKIAAFKYPQKYFIYDSRVAYSLDWLLIKSKMETKYFYIPNGRNTFLEKYNMKDMVISLKGNFYKKRFTYLLYNKLIEEIFNKIKIFDKPYNVEMFLWGLFEIIKPEVQKYWEKK